MNVSSPWWGEHRSRYRLAQRHVDQGRVLDIACGTGFGAEMLRQAGAAEVVGCDASEDAVIEARRNFGSSAVHFVLGDGTRLPFGDGRFDAVVSFETLEHIPDASRFLDELRRVVRPGGLLLLSTPNAAITSLYRRNPYHCREYTAEELLDLLESFFDRVELFGQSLPSTYRVAPFLPGWDRPRTAADVPRLALWKLSNRLPAGLRNRLAHLFLGRDFYPSERDYVFVPEFDRAHVLLAICRA